MKRNPPSSSGKTEFFRGMFSTSPTKCIVAYDIDRNITKKVAEDELLKTINKHVPVKDIQAFGAWADSGRVMIVFHTMEDAMTMMNRLKGAKFGSRPLCLAYVRTDDDNERSRSEPRARSYDRTEEENYPRGQLFQEAGMDSETSEDTVDQQLRFMQQLHHLPANSNSTNLLYANDDQEDEAATQSYSEEGANMSESEGDNYDEEESSNQQEQEVESDSNNNNEEQEEQEEEGNNEEDDRSQVEKDLEKIQELQERIHYLKNIRNILMETQRNTQLDYNNIVGAVGGGGDEEDQSSSNQQEEQSIEEEGEDEYGSSSQDQQQHEEDDTVSTASSQQQHQQIYNESSSDIEAVAVDLNANARRLRTASPSSQMSDRARAAYENEINSRRGGKVHRQDQGGARAALGNYNDYERPDSRMSSSVGDMRSASRLSDLGAGGSRSASRQSVDRCGSGMSGGSNTSINLSEREIESIANQAKADLRDLKLAVKYCETLGATSDRRRFLRDFFAWFRLKRICDSPDQQQQQQQQQEDATAFQYERYPGLLEEVHLSQRPASQQQQRRVERMPARAASAPLVRESAASQQRQQQQPGLSALRNKPQQSHSSSSSSAADNRATDLLSSCDDPDLIMALIRELKDVRDAHTLSECVQQIREIKHNADLIRYWQSMGTAESSENEDDNTAAYVEPSASAVPSYLRGNRPATAGGGFKTGLASPETRAPTQRPTSASSSQQQQRASNRGTLSSSTSTSGSSAKVPTPKQVSPPVIAAAAAVSTQCNDKEGLGRPPTRRGRDVSQDRPASASNSVNQSPNLRDVNYFVHHLAESIESPNKIPSPSNANEDHVNAEYIDDGEAVHVGDDQHSPARNEYDYAESVDQTPRESDSAMDKDSDQQRTTTEEEDNDDDEDEYDEDGGSQDEDADDENDANGDDHGDRRRYRQIRQSLQNHDHSRELGVNDTIVGILDREMSKIISSRSPKPVRSPAAAGGGGSASSPQQNRCLVDDEAVTRLLTALFGALTANNIAVDSALRQALVEAVAQYEGADLERAQKSITMDVYDILHDEMIFLSVVKQVDRSYKEEMDALQKNVKPNTSSLLIKELRLLETQRDEEIKRLLEQRAKRLATRESTEASERESAQEEEVDEDEEDEEDGDDGDEANTTTNEGDSQQDHDQSQEGEEDDDDEEGDDEDEDEDVDFTEEDLALLAELERQKQELALLQQVQQMQQLKAQLEQRQAELAMLHERHAELQLMETRARQEAAALQTLALQERQRLLEAQQGQMRQIPEEEDNDNHEENGEDEDDEDDEDGQQEEEGDGDDNNGDDDDEEEEEEGNDDDNEAPLTEAEKREAMQLMAELEKQQRILNERRATLAQLYAQRQQLLLAQQHLMEEQQSRIIAANGSSNEEASETTTNAAINATDYHQSMPPERDNDNAYGSNAQPSPNRRQNASAASASPQQNSSLQTRPQRPTDENDEDDSTNTNENGDLSANLEMLRLLQVLQQKQQLLAHKEAQLRMLQEAQRQSEEEGLVAVEENPEQDNEEEEEEEEEDNEDDDENWSNTRSDTEQSRSDMEELRGELELKHQQLDELQQRVDALTTSARSMPQDIGSMRGDIAQLQSRIDNTFSEATQAVTTTNDANRHMTQDDDPNDSGEDSSDQHDPMFDLDGSSQDFSEPTATDTDSADSDSMREVTIDDLPADFSAQGTASAATATASGSKNSKKRKPTLPVSRIKQQGGGAAAIMSPKSPESLRKIEFNQHGMTVPPQLAAEIDEKMAEEELGFPKEPVGDPEAGVVPDEYFCF